ncbi:uncharacterized protein LOC110117577 [Ceratitis capitata]|uniref:Protein PF14-0175 n=1 Tax=Ceratitis capitata TaxID=7213 RepID=W8B9E6_CERCA|nr:uncharacterized protein LOC110117577 [Ceratitis capitata]
MATRSAVPLPPTADTKNCLQCLLCHRYHALRNCPAFRVMRPLQRIVVANAQGYCGNCLALTHVTEECDSLESCRRCNKAHHTMLHPSEPQTSGLIPKPTTKPKKQLHHRATQQRAIEQRTTQQRTSQQRPTQQRVIKQRAIQQRAIQQRATQQRAPQRCATQQRSTSSRASPPRATQQRATQQRAIRKSSNESQRSCSVAHTSTGLETKGFRNRTAKGAIGEAIRALKKLQNALSNASLQGGQDV